MSKQYSVQESDSLLTYLEKTLKPEDPFLKQVRENIRSAGLPDISVCSFDGLHIEVLTQMMQAKKIVEIGSLGGYSTIRMARQLADDGKIYAFEVNEKNAQLAQENFKLCLVDHKIELIVGDAKEKLKTIEHLSPFDLVFIDANKEAYPFYASWAKKHLRLGGVIIGDNTFSFGRIADESIESPSESLLAMRGFNLGLAQDPAFKTTILPTGEGMTISVKIK
jgi:predicted O-methyltransferase YrrM